MAPPYSNLDQNHIIQRAFDEASDSLKVTVSGAVLEVNLDHANDEVAVYGNDGVVNRILKTDAAGELQIDVLSSALPSGASTSALQTSGNVSLASIDTDIDVALSTRASEVTLSALNAKFNSLGQKPMATSAPVVLASDQSAIPVTLSALDIVDFIDVAVGPVLDASVTNIPASAGSPQEIVASLAANVKKLKINDTTGFFIGVYTGAAASEVLQAIVGPGEDGVIEVIMSSGERVSLRHMQNSAIVSGEIALQFLG